jgi:hypothetical protein
MSKRHRQQTKTASRSDRSRSRHGAKPHEAAASTGVAAKPADAVAYPPTKHLSLLAISIILFAGWFVFLLITALLR